MENVLGMHLRALCYARLIDLFNAKEMKGFRGSQNHFLTSKRRQSRFATANRGRAACGSCGSSAQGTRRRHIACKMSILSYNNNKCTFEQDLLWFRMRCAREGEQTRRGNAALAYATENEHSTTHDCASITRHQACRLMAEK